MSTIWLEGDNDGYKLREPTGLTGIRLDGRCEDGLGWQRDRGGGCSTTRERQEGVEIPGAHVDD